jgi:hypothetical protein
MHIGVFPAAAMPDIRAELEHLEAIRQNSLTELSVGLPVLLGFGRQIKHYEYPHNAIGV